MKAPIDVLGLSNGARSGLTGFVAGLARQPKLAAANVTLNNLLPGWFDTDRIRTTMQAAATKSGQSVEAMIDKRRVAIPAQRMGTADEFGAFCAFLCSASGELPDRPEHPARRRRLPRHVLTRGADESAKARA